MSADSASRPSNGTNSVTAENGRETASADAGGLPTPEERVSEFIEEYPELAFMEISERPGQKLREEVAIENRRELYVSPVQPSEEGFTVEEVTERRSVMWAAVLDEYLQAHEGYRDAGLKMERGAESFVVPLNDSWGRSYADREYAKAKAVEREISGGERPTGGMSLGEWSGGVVTVMLSLTASSTPGGDRLPPVDHLRDVQDAFSYDGVRDTLRNVVEKDIGLDPDEWGYWPMNEVHDGGGENACYSHTHVGVYLNLDADEWDLNELGGRFEKVIDKHVEVCDPARFEAHDYTQYDYVEDSGGPISVNGDVDNMGSYMAEYAGNYGGELLRRPIEYLAWGAIHWATNSQRSRRSKTLNQAIRADACKQEFESPECEQSHDHGDRLMYDGRGNVVCAECGSGWGIPDGATVTSVRLGDADIVVADGGELTPEEELRGRWSDARSATVADADGVVSFERPPRWRPVAVVRGTDEYPVSSSGGVEMVELKLPSEKPPPEFPVNGYGAPVDGPEPDPPPDEQGGEFPVGRVERYVENNPGASPMEVVAQTGVDPSHLSRVEEMVEDA